MKKEYIRIHASHRAGSRKTAGFIAQESLSSSLSCNAIPEQTSLKTKKPQVEESTEVLHDPCWA